jgi:hypothetical protein
MGLFSLLIYEISGSTGDILICCLLGICLFSVADYHKYKTGFAQIKDKIRKDLNFRIAVFFVKPVSGHQVKPPGHAAGEFLGRTVVGVAKQRHRAHPCIHIHCQTVGILAPQQFGFYGRGDGRIIHNFTETAFLGSPCR